MLLPRLTPAGKALICFTAIAVGACGSSNSGPPPDYQPVTDPIIIPSAAPAAPPPAPSGPANAVADAGADQDVARNSPVVLDGSASTDPDGDPLSYRWIQLSGPDVTRGAGYLDGVSPGFIAPSRVSTLLFDLKVNDGNGDSPADLVQVNVLEHTGAALYVDGDNGDDSSGDGSRARPFASISRAIAGIASADQDIYVRTLGAGVFYDETAATLEIPDGSSLYGGYGDDWVRDVDSNRTRLLGHRIAVRFAQIDGEAWFSGFELTARRDTVSTDPETSAVSVDAGSGILHIEDNVISAARGSAAPTGNYYGLRLGGIGAVRVLRNRISADDAGDGISDGIDGAAGKPGGDGAPAGSQDGGAGGASALIAPDPPAYPDAIANQGGDGGRGGDPGGGDGQPGLAGSRPDDLASGSGAAGGDGGSIAAASTAGGNGEGGASGFMGGDSGRGGIGGDGGTGNGTIAGGHYLNDSAADGAIGGHGVGGGGGGGGSGGALIAGGGGGGGGAGGIGGVGGTAGDSGYASIGILLDDVADAVIEFNTITSGNGGNGRAGGRGGIGGKGGNGAPGRAADTDAAAGGHGGGGGQGGEGGQGGAGAGGPSYAIMVGANIAPLINNNHLIIGNGGEPGAAGPGISGGAVGGRHGEDGASGGAGGDGHATTSRSDEGLPAEGGWVYGIYDVDPLDGMVPVAPTNRMTRGFAGTGGTAGFKNF